MSGRNTPSRDAREGGTCQRMRLGKHVAKDLGIGRGAAASRIRGVLISMSAGLIPVLILSAALAGELERPVDRTGGKERLTAGTGIYKPGIPEPAPETGGPLKITIEDAVLLALENNRSLALERLNPAIRRTFEGEERATFDPVLDGSIDYSRRSFKERSRTLRQISDDKTRDTEAKIGVSKFFATGTDAGVDVSSYRPWTAWYGDWYEYRVGLSVTQALLQGRGKDVNLARLRQAEIDTRISEYELRGFAETLVASVEEIYWDYALAQRRIEIVLASLKVVEQQLRETEEMVSVGKLAETELTAVQAEMALRRQDLINARSSRATTNLQLLRLINPGGGGPLAGEVHLLNGPLVPEFPLDPVDAHVALARHSRPDLNQARLGVRVGEIEIVRTRNGMLPKMDLFITLGKTGYAESFGRSISDITDDGYDAMVGLTFQYPFRNRGARARHERATLSRDQALRALDNLSQLVELDVRSAYIEVTRARQQISATSATRKLQEEKMRIEAEKFRVGRSTSFLVAQVHRDLISSQISEVEAVVSYLKALVELHRLEGSLLSRRGILAPGQEPVDPDLEMLE